MWSSSSSQQEFVKGLETRQATFKSTSGCWSPERETQTGNELKDSLELCLEQCNAYDEACSAASVIDHVSRTTLAAT